MLLTLALWALMAGIAYAAGIGILSPSAVTRAGDRLMAALWIGFVVVSNCWLALALAMPLTFWRTLAITALGIGGAWLYRYRYRRTPDWTFLPSAAVFAIPWRTGLLGAAGLGGLSLLAAQEVANIDTGGYHYPLTRWLAEHGVTPGLALLQLQYGYASPWYAFVAPFEAGYWQGRIGCAGGFPLALLALHGLIAVERIRRSAARLSDWLILFSGVLAVSLTFLSPVIVGAASLSTDTPVAALIIATAWALLAHAESRQIGHPPEAIAPPPSIPFLMSVGALAVKLSAAPLVLLTTLFLLRQKPLAGRTFRLLAGALTLLLTPVTVAKLLLSGYPFFPFQLAGWQTEWAFDPQALALANLEIRDFSRWQWHTLPKPRYSAGWLDLAWLPYWARFETLAATYLGLLVPASLALRPAIRKCQTLAWLVACAWAGGLYVLFFAPSLRLGIGFLALLPSLWLAWLFWERRVQSGAFVAGFILLVTSAAVFYCSPLGGQSLLVVTGISVAAWLSIAWHATRQPGSAWAGAFLAALLSLPMIITVLRYRPQLHVLHPAAMPRQPLEAVSINGIEMYRPIIRAGKYPLCWGSPLPCAVNPDPTIALRDPQRGLAAGFKRQARSCRANSAWDAFRDSQPRLGDHPPSHAIVAAKGF